MIPRSPASLQVASWRAELKRAFRRPADLFAYLGLDAGTRFCRAGVTDELSMLVPPHYADLMAREDPKDPLLLQVLPRNEELLPRGGFVDDPVGDRSAYVVPGLLQKYRGRALVLATSACAVHCRYCFRRHFGPVASTATPREWPAIIHYLARDRSIREVILSGGDPLMLEDNELAIRIEALAGLAHIRRLRLHTRLPVVLPSRVTGSLVESLTDTRLCPVVVLHVNHPNELHSKLQSALDRLRERGISLLNQAVLLKGVNDKAETLIALSEALFEMGVLPYYLHLLDRVRGSAHFEVEEHSALTLYRILQRDLPGYLVPRLVREVPSADSKTPILA